MSEPLNARDVPVPTPCDASWSEMTGAGPTRFCARCQHEVSDLSAMTADEARALLAKGPACVRYRAHPKTGRLVHRRPVLAGLAAAALGVPAAASVAPTGHSPGLLERALAWLVDGVEEEEPPAAVAHTQGVSVGSVGMTDTECQRLKDLGYMTTCRGDLPESEEASDTAKALDEDTIEHLQVMGYIE